MYGEWLRSIQPQGEGALVAARWITALGLQLVPLLAQLLRRQHVGTPERIPAHPVIQLANIAMAALVTVVYGFGLYASTYLIPVVLQSALGYDATNAGLAQLPSGILLAVVIPLAGVLTDRYSPRWITVWGLALFGLFVAFFLSFDLKFAIILEKFPNLAGFKLGPNGFLQGAALTLFLCLCSMVVSVLLGFAAALARLSNSAVLVGVASFYTSFFRGTPLLIQILLIYLGLPQLGVVPGAISAGIIALSLNYGAYLSEIFRAGLLGVARGQSEAALALGMRPRQILFNIILPQAMRVIIPPTANQFISMLKDSSLISVMGVWEVMFLAQSYGRSSYRYIEMLTTAAIIYWVMSLGLELIQARMERHYGKGYVRRG